MPRVSEFYGIIIWMYPHDHAPPHFHATYGECEAVFRIETLELLVGSLPRRAGACVLEWSAVHRRELAANWNRGQNGIPLERIEPLE